MKKLFLLSSLVFNIIFCFSQNLTISVSENHFGIDEDNSLIVSHIESIDNYTNTAGFDEIIINLGQNNYSFNLVPDSLVYSNSYLITDTNTSKQYTLYFTQLPLILIESTTTIVDEPKVLANFIFSDNNQILISNVGIEIRGGSSQLYPKKTYDLEFWEDTIGDNTVNVQFGSLRTDDDWILDALYNEPLRLRSYVANKLWLDMHTPSYIDSEPNAKSGADVQYVEMFLNGQYNGLYNLSEQVDKKQLKIKSYNDNIRGELYKGISGGATDFNSLPDYDNENRIWGGYEVKYPKEADITDWENLYLFTDFVMNSSETDFTNSIWTKFDEENYINYFLFLNLVRAHDNRGKNLYLAKYNTNEPYFYVPWDLDGCFGTDWNGDNFNITDDILINGFMDRVINIDPNDISINIANKWFDYRNNIFSSETLSNSISEQYNFLNINKIYERESLVFPNYLFQNEDLSYTLTWLENRLEYLDIYFGNALSINDKTYTNIAITIYPNPAEDRVYISSLNKLIGKKYKIYTNLGQLVTEDIINNNYISIKRLNQGLYFIVIDRNSFKLIKK